MSTKKTQTKKKSDSKQRHKIKATKDTQSKNMRPYYDFAQDAKRYIRSLWEEEVDLEFDSYPLSWYDVKQTISNALDAVFNEVNNIPRQAKTPKPPIGVFSIPPFDERVGWKKQILFHLEKYFNRTKNRTFALLHENRNFPLHLYNLTPLFKLIHKLRYTLDFYDSSIPSEIPDDIYQEATDYAEKNDIPEETCLQILNKFFKEEMRNLKHRRDSGQRFYRK
jgi:hypothetical protein